jgi:hypothetical protein
MAISPKKRKAPATAAAAAKRPAVANPYAKNNTDGRLAALAEEQELGDSTTAPNNVLLQFFANWILRGLDITTVFKRSNRFFMLGHQWYLSLDLGAI